jgi:hypothetical protein
VRWEAEAEESEETEDLSDWEVESDPDWEAEPEPENPDQETLPFDFE